MAGGTGAIGRHLIPALIAEGHQVTASTRSAGSAGRAKDLAAAGAVLVVMDGLDRDAVLAPDIADGMVQAIRCVVTPDKLRHLGPVSELAAEPPPETR